MESIKKDLAMILPGVKQRFPPGLADRNKKNIKAIISIIHSRETIELKNRTYALILFVSL